MVNLTTMALYADNTELLEEMYANYKANPLSVEKDWQDFFRELDMGVSFSNGANGKNGHKDSNTFLKDSSAATFQEMGLMNLLNAYRRQGHLAANLDPLGHDQEKRVGLGGFDGQDRPCVGFLAGQLGQRPGYFQRRCFCPALGRGGPAGNFRF